MKAEHRFVLVTDGSFGDVLPFVGLAKQLMNRGSDVLLVAGPETRLLARSENIPFQPVTVPAESEPLRPDQPFRTFVRLTEQRVIGSLEQTTSSLSEVVTENDVLVAHPIQVSAAILARARSLPWITVSPATWLFPNKQRMPLYLPRRSLGQSVNTLAWRWFGSLLSRRFLDRIRTVARQHGLVVGPISILDFLRSPSGTILLTSPLMLDGRKLPPDVIVTGLARWDVNRLWRNRLAVQELFECREPLIAFRAPPNLPSGPLRDAARHACRRLNARGLFIDHSVVRPTVDGPLYVDRYVPLSLVASRVELAAHYGGIGTATAFAAAGCPAVITPSIVDQFENADVIAAHRAGIRLDWHRLTPARLERDLLRARELATPAEEIGRRMRDEDGLTVAADAVLAAVA